MKRLLLGCALLLVSAPVASAIGLDIAWMTCLQDGGAGLRSSSCTSNLDAGTNLNILDLSLTLGADMTQFQGAAVTVDITTTGNVPGWWGNACAAKPPGAVFQLTGSNASCTSTAYGSVAPSGGITAMTYGWGGPSTARLEFSLANLPGNETTLLAGTEYFLGQLTLSNAASTGVGACPGCVLPACLRFAKAIVTRAGDPVPVVLTQGNLQSFVFWQTGTTPCTYTPTRNSTWGGIKSLYR